MTSSVTMNKVELQEYCTTRVSMTEAERAQSYDKNAIGLIKGRSVINKTEICERNAWRRCRIIKQPKQTLEHYVEFCYVRGSHFSEQNENQHN